MTEEAQRQARDEDSEACGAGDEPEGLVHRAKTRSKPRRARPAEPKACPAAPVASARRVAASAVALLRKHLGAP